MSGGSGFTAFDAIDLLEWKHEIFDLYADIRAAPVPERAWRHWRSVRDRLYRDHPQSPLPAADRAGFEGCSFYDYDPSWRVVATIEDADQVPAEVPVSTDTTMAFTRIGIAHFTVRGSEQELELSWNEGYGGGVFLAFTDETSGETTYGGGRYLIDTVKGADLGFDRENSRLVLDFNFAFNPSCSYDARWACPLAPAVNRLPLAVTAGEKHRP